ncbi:MAG TPA: hypothetical protein DCF89_03010, partial [Flavobacteriales bacterium]|nr:hypothetical protein [Flavobacteriales bacterium]
MIDLFGTLHTFLNRQALFNHNYAMRKIVLIAFLLLPLISFGQEMVTISGYIEDAENGEKLLGGTVFDLRSKKGAATNDYGFY